MSTNLDLLRKGIESGSVHPQVKDCLEAFTSRGEGTLAQHVHHKRWLEILTQPVEDRIICILVEKDPSEVPTRLHRLRPFPTDQIQRIISTIVELHNKERETLSKYDAAYRTYRNAATSDERSSARDELDTLNDLSIDLNAKVEALEIQPEVLSLHTAICGCPWGKDTDIFGKPRYGY